MTLLKYASRYPDDLNPNQLAALLPETPTPQAIVGLKNQLDLINSKLHQECQTLETLNYGTLTAGVLSVLAAVGTGGVGAGVLACVSVVGAASTFWHGDQLKDDNDRTLEFTVKLSNILDRANPHRVAGLWKLCRSKEQFWQFLTEAAIDGYETDNGIKVKACVDGTWYGLAPTQALCERFASEFGLSPEELLENLEAVEVERRQTVKPEMAPSPQMALPSRGDRVETIPVDVIPIAKSTPSSLQSVGGLTNSPPPTSAPIAPTAFEVLVGNPYLSRAGFGAQRTGKSYLLAVASRELANRGTKIFHINLASYGDEDGRYWQHATRSVRCDLPTLNEYQAQHYIDLAIEVVSEFFATRHAILIFDEIVLTGSLNNQHAELVTPLLKLTADKMACLASTGVKRSQAIWTASPDFVAGSCTQDCKALKSLSLCFVAIAPGKSVEWDGSPVQFHRESFENVSRNFSALTYPPRNLKGDRICFIDGQWREVGELPGIPEVATVAATSSVPSDNLIVEKLERSYQQLPAPTPDRFEEFAVTLTQPGQEQLRSFVEWLGKRKGEEVSYDQIKDSWARHNGVSRSKEAVMPFVHFLVHQRLLTRSTNNKWLVSDG